MPIMLHHNRVRFPWELFPSLWQAQELTLPTRKESLNKFDPGLFDTWTPTFSAKIPMLFEPYKHPSHQNLFQNIAAGTTEPQNRIHGNADKARWQATFGKRDKIQRILRLKWPC